jgi:hypothetical protein
MMKKLLVQLQRVRVSEYTGNTPNLVKLRRIRAQVASHRPIRAEDRVQLHVNPRAICNG